MSSSSISQRGPTSSDSSTDSWEVSDSSPRSTDDSLGDFCADEPPAHAQQSHRSEGDSDFSEFCYIQRKKRNKRLWKLLLRMMPPLDITSSDDEDERDTSFSSSQTSSEELTSESTGTSAPKKVRIKLHIDYGTWLRRKNKELAEKAARERKDADKKLAAAQERKRLAAAKYEEWCKAKSTMSLMSQKKSSEIVQRKASCPRVVDVRESQMKVQKWETRKRLEAERQRKLRREEEQRVCQLQEERRKMSVQVWRQWSAEAVKKPKPTPLSRGLLTLCGSAPCFVNPNKWHGPLTDRDD